MRTPRPRNLTLVPTMLAFALMASTSSFAAPGNTLDAVHITGWVHVEDIGFEKTRVLLHIKGEEHWVPITPMGRFDIDLPVGAEAVLRFEHPGHLAKEVLVDTHGANAGEFEDGTRRLRMAVILELERLMAGQKYAGPVGNIAFDKDGGCVAVDRTRRMVVGRTNEPMVF
ncbi:MAG: hypothetical protein IPJ76_17045 [Flavobacteriales bacterium]|nr:MAG: hypothetical protein IPJ76_17045 [Flavobacteriales bacterium]